jgi:hypothetical protein
MVAVYGEAKLDWGVADKVKDIIADVDKGGLKTADDEIGSVPMKESLKAAADETGSVPMERKSMGIPS